MIPPSEFTRKLQMKISECMSRDVKIATSDHTLQSAAQIMAEIDAGFLPVTDGKRLLGTVTDRDIAIRGVAAGHPPSASIREVMSADLRCCNQDADVSEVLERMSKLQLRRLPVIDDDKNLVGIVSITDLTTSENPDEAGEALRNIARPSDRHSQQA